MQISDQIGPTTLQVSRKTNIVTQTAVKSISVQVLQNTQLLIIKEFSAFSEFCSLLLQSFTISFNTTFHKL